MILQALCDYYDRCAANKSKTDLPIYGFELKEIPYTIVIDKDGKFVNLEDNKFKKDNKVFTRSFLVPQSAIRSGAKSYSIANCLWDHYGYVLAQTKPDLKETDDVEKHQKLASLQFESFLKKTEQIAHDTKSDAVGAVVKFLQNATEIEKVKNHKSYADALKIKGCNFAFRINNDTELVCQKECIQKWVEAKQGDNEENLVDGICLVSGEKGKVTRLHNPISGVTQKPAPLASINDDAYCSYGKSKAFNFPTSPQVVFKYTAALNRLLKKESPNKLRIGNTVTVFWSQKPSNLESRASAFIKNTDDPDLRIDKIRDSYNSIHNGKYIGADSKVPFYILGLSPNVSRIAIRFWLVGTVADFSEKLVEWFDDINIVNPFARNEMDRFPIIALLKGTALLDKEDDPRLSGLYDEIIRSVFMGLALPASLLKAVLLRIKAEKGYVKPQRAALIKAWINRYYRQHNNVKERVKMTLDVNEMNIGYNLGCLFAILEKLQESANPEINSTIRDRFYSSASCTPQSVFGTLMRLHTFHLRKLSNISSRIYYEKKISGVMDKISEFPAHLNLEQQGFFAIGYYHQRQDLFTSKTNKEEEK